MEQRRSSFSSKLGFVLAAAGSAVGLGNLWRFPYLAAKFGGGLFLLIYVAFALTFGFALMIAEISIGRKTRLSTISAFRALDKRFSIIGWLGAVVPAIITPYYCVIGGWVLKYLCEFVVGNGGALKDSAFFGAFISSINNEPFIWFAVFLGLTIVVIILGVEKGIEAVSKVMMPILVLIVLFIAVYVLTLPNACEGVKYFLKPDFSNFSANTALQAMSQLFYSLSLAMGIMITYGSYMKKDAHIESSVWQIEIFDTGVAVLAGLAIIPAVFACADPAADLQAGPGLMFIVLPKVFNLMPQPMGQIIAVLFFLLVFFAALTSSISLFETNVSVVVDKAKCPRPAGIAATAIVCMIFGFLSAAGYGPLAGITPMKMQFLDFFDFISNSVLMPIVALLTCIFVGWFLKPETIIAEVESSWKFRWKKLFAIVIKYVAPVITILILLGSLNILK